MSNAAASLQRLEELEAQFDGPIPPHLRDGRSAYQLERDQRTAMVRFHGQRIRDFLETLAKIENIPDPGTRAAWRERTVNNINFHTADQIKQLEALEALEARAGAAS